MLPRFFRKQKWSFFHAMPIILALAFLVVAPNVVLSFPSNRLLLKRHATTPITFSIQPRTISLSEMKNTLNDAAGKSKSRGQKRLYVPKPSKRRSLGFGSSLKEFMMQYSTMGASPKYLDDIDKYRGYVRARERFYRYNVTEYEALEQKGLLDRIVSKEIRDDYRRRKKFYLSDWTDAFQKKNIKKVVPAILFLYFSCLAPAVSFGTIASQITTGSIGIVEFLLSSGLSGMAYAGIVQGLVVSISSLSNHPPLTLPRSCSLFLSSWCQFSVDSQWRLLLQQGLPSPSFQVCSDSAPSTRSHSFRYTPGLGCGRASSSSFLAWVDPVNSFGSVRALQMRFSTLSSA
jgi:hypothetical protein